jgi:hypothetical protein
MSNYSYEATLAASEKVNWRLEDVIGTDQQLDFSRPFMPDSLARVESLDFLTSDEKLTLNQIRGHEYLCIFGIVEEFIVPYVLDLVRPQVNGEDYQIRALLQFATEEAKHIHLFRRFQESFDRSFGTKCNVIGPAADIGKFVLSHDPLSVGLAILQIEWMTQRHYLDSVVNNEGLDPLFKSLLKHHWMEEAQHAKLDTLLVAELGKGKTPEQIQTALDGYLDIGMFIDNGLKAQTLFDLEAFESATGRILNEEEKAEFIEKQHQAARWTYLGSGMTHKNFLASLDALPGGGRERIEQVAPVFS